VAPVSLRKENVVRSGVEFMAKLIAK